MAALIRKVKRAGPRGAHCTGCGSGPSPHVTQRGNGRPLLPPAGKGISSRGAGGSGLNVLRSNSLSREAGNGSEIKYMRCHRNSDNVQVHCTFSSVILHADSYWPVLKMNCQKNFILLCNCSSLRFIPLPNFKETQPQTIKLNPYDNFYFQPCVCR